MTKRRLGFGILAVLIALIVGLGVQSKELTTEIEISASPAVVWKILIELDRYQDWNPHITRAEGEVSEGSKLIIEIEEPDGSGMTFEPTVTRVVSNSELRWLGRLLLPRILDGEHIFEISEMDGGGVRFVQRETFRGLLVLPLWGKLDTDTRHGFESMNAALKARAEALGG